MFDKFKKAYLKIIQEAALEKDPGLKTSSKRRSTKGKNLVNKDEIFARLNKLDLLSTVKTFNTVYVLLTDKDGYLLPQDFLKSDNDQQDLNACNWKKINWEIKNFEFKEYSNNTVTFLMNVHKYTYYPFNIFPKNMTYELSFENVEPDIVYGDFVAKFKSIFLNASDIDSDCIEFCGPEHTPKSSLIYECGESNYSSQHAYSCGGSSSSNYSCGGSSSSNYSCGGSSDSNSSVRNFERMKASQDKWEKEQQLKKERRGIWYKRVDELKEYGQFEQSSMMCINFLKPGNAIAYKAAEVLNEEAKKWLDEKIN